MSAAFIGLDLAKSVFQVHGVDAQGKAGQSGEAYKVLSQDRRRAVGYVCPDLYFCRRVD
jgi:hypothetical protein